MIKKSYIKPSMSFFALEIDDAEPTACAFQQTFPEYECAIDIGGGLTVLTKNSCKYHGSEYDDYICYHNPAPSINIFGS